ncbi:MAG: hypothetical protein R6V55_04990, partial [Desulfovermiculus sp.]
MAHHSWTLEELAAWAGTQGFRPLWNRACLCPHPDIWPGQLSLQACLSSITQALPPQEFPLLQALCLSGLALTPKPDPNTISILQSWTSPQDIGLSLSWSELTNPTWHQIPLLLADERTGRAILLWTLVVNRFEQTDHIVPLWAATCMEQKALAAVHKAAELERPASGAGLFFWPILDFTKPGIQIRGSSLGLPALLGFHAANTNTPSPNLAATGSLTSDGRLLPASHLESKAKAAKSAGFRGLLFPCPGHSPALSKTISDLEFLPVPDLSTARTLWRLYSPGQGATLIQALQPQDTPQQVVSSLLCLSEQTIRHLEQQYGLIRRAIRSVFNSANIYGLRQILDVSCPQDSESVPNQALIQAILDSVQTEDMNILYAQSPELCLRLCRLQLMRCRHQGRLADWEEWEKWLEEHKLERVIACSDQGETKLIMLLAERIVQDEHNRFCFDPAMNDKLGLWFESVLQDEKNRFERRLKFRNPSVHRALGCFYGTMAQHFGFCGPAYLDLCRTYVHRAQIAFGQGKIADYREDWLREFCYLMYAYLDAGMLDEARTMLQTYLECPDLEKFDPQTSNPFHHAAYVRFLADNGRELPRSYAEFWSSRLDHIPSEHPWQLWAVNFGRLMPGSVRHEVWISTTAPLVDHKPWKARATLMSRPSSP